MSFLKFLLYFIVSTLIWKLLTYNIVLFGCLLWFGVGVYGSICVFRWERENGLGFECYLFMTLVLWFGPLGCMMVYFVYNNEVKELLDNIFPYRITFQSPIKVLKKSE